MSSSFDKRPANNLWQAFVHMFVIQPRRQLRELYTFILLFSLAAALITIFEPIFFWQLGLPLWLIALYYALHYTLYVILMPWGAQFSARFGLERSLAIAAAIFVIYFMTLAALPQYPTLFFIALAVLTIHKIFFWPAFHALFAQFSDGKNRGTEQSWVRLFTSGASIVGPLMGGVIAALYGFPALFLAAGATVFLAGLVLLKTRETNHIQPIAYRTPWRLLASKRHRSLLIGSLAWGENLIHLVFWPIFMFTIVGNVETIGLIAAFSAAVVTLWGFVVGELNDRLSSRGLLRLFTPLLMASYIFRPLSRLPWHVVLNDVFAAIGQVAVTIPLTSRLYKTGRGVGSLRYALTFETALAAVKAAVGWALVILFLTLPASVAFPTTFILAGVLGLFYMRF